MSLLVIVLIVGARIDRSGQPRLAGTLESA